MVKLVNDSDFESIIKANKYVVMEYFTDWCGSCRLFAPRFEELSNNPIFSGITFLKINAEENPKARKIVDFSFLPFFVTFRDGAFHEGLSTVNEEVLTMMLKELAKLKIGQH